MLDKYYWTCNGKAGVPRKIWGAGIGHAFKEMPRKVAKAMASVNSEGMVGLLEEFEKMKEACATLFDAFGSRGIKAAIDVRKLPKLIPRGGSPSQTVEDVVDEPPVAEISSSKDAVQGARQVFDETPEPICNWKSRVSDAHQVFDVMSTPTVSPNEGSVDDDRAGPVVKEVVDEPLLAEISKDKDLAVSARQVFDEMSKPTPTPGELETSVVVGVEPQR